MSKLPTVILTNFCGNFQSSACLYSHFSLSIIIFALEKHIFILLGFITSALVTMTMAGTIGDLIAMLTLERPHIAYREYSIIADLKLGMQPF